MVKLGKKGSIYLYLTAVLGILMLTTVWILIDEGIVDFVFPQTQNYIVNETNSVIGNRTATTIEQMETVWIFYPALVLLGLIIWVFVEVQRR